MSFDDEYAALSACLSTTDERLEYLINDEDETRFFEIDCVGGIGDVDGADVCGADFC